MQDKIKIFIKGKSMIKITKKLFWFLAVSSSINAMGLDAEKLKASAQKELMNKNYPKAMKIFARAAKVDKDDSFSRKMFFLLRKVIRQEKSFMTEINPVRKELLGKNIRTFFFCCRDFERILKINKELYRIKPSESNRFDLAISLIDLKKIKQAEALLTTVKKKIEFSDLILMSLLEAKNGNSLKAQKNISKLKRIPKNENNNKYFLALARTYALIEKTDKCCSELIKAFKNINHDLLPVVKAYVMECSDFQSIKNSPKLKSAMQTKSEIECKDCNN